MIQREWERDRLGREKGQKWRGKTGERVVGRNRAEGDRQKAKMMAGRGSWEKGMEGGWGEGEERRWVKSLPAVFTFKKFTYYKHHSI